MYVDVVVEWMQIFANIIMRKNKYFKYLSNFNNKTKNKQKKSKCIFLKTGSLPK